MRRGPSLFWAHRADVAESGPTRLLLVPCAANCIIRRCGGFSPALPRCEADQPQKPVLGSQRDEVEGVQTMYRQSNPAAHARAGLIAVALTAGSFVIAAAPAFAWPVGESGDVSIANFTTKAKDGGVLTLKDAKFVNANLSEEEIVKMLTADTPEDDKRALVKKLKADKITIGSVEITAKDGGAFHLHDFAASDVDAGKVGKLDIAGVDGSGTSDGSAVSVKSGALSVEALDLASALKASGAVADADQGDPIGGLGRLGHLNWSGLDIVTPDAESGPGKTMHVAIGSIDVRSDFAGDAFRQGSTKLTGVVVEFSPDSESGKGLASLGYSRLELGLALGADYKLG